VQCRKMSNVLTQWDRNLMNATSIWIPSLRFAIKVPFSLPFGHPSQIILTPTSAPTHLLSTTCSSPPPILALFRLLRKRVTSLTCAPCVTFTILSSSGGFNPIPPRRWLFSQISSSAGPTTSRASSACHVSSSRPPVPLACRWFFP
jgi:hypothetical protein